MYVTLDGANGVNFVANTELGAVFQPGPGPHTFEAEFVDGEGEVIGERVEFPFRVAEDGSSLASGLLHYVPSNLLLDPFPIYAMPKVFDDAVYRELRRTWPEDKWWPEETVQLGKRKTFKFTSPGFQDWLATAPVWKRLVDWMHSMSYVEMVDRLFPDDLKRKYGAWAATAARHRRGAREASGARPRRCVVCGVRAGSCRSALREFSSTVSCVSALCRRGLLMGF